MVYDKLTGKDLSADGAGTGYKEMCLNCRHCCQVEDTINTTNEQYVCTNEGVLEQGKKKILDAVPDGFVVRTLELAPMKLKNPTKKCSMYDFSINAVTDFIREYFTPASSSEIPSETPSETPKA